MKTNYQYIINRKIKTDEKYMGAVRHPWPTAIGLGEEIKTERLRTAHNRSVYAASPSLSSAPWARKTAVGLFALCAVFSSPHFGCLQTQKQGRKNI